MCFVLCPSQEQTRVCTSQSWKKPLPQTFVAKNSGYILIPIKENVICHVSVVEGGVYIVQGMGFFLSLSPFSKCFSLRTNIFLVPRISQALW